MMSVLGTTQGIYVTHVLPKRQFGGALSVRELGIVTRIANDRKYTPELCSINHDTLMYRV